MDAFLAWLEKYELLMELIITIVTISLSLLAVFQTKSIAKRQLEQEKNIAKQQTDLQERQIKISVYEQKNEINKALNIVFNVVTRMNYLFKHLDVETLSQSKIYDLLKYFVQEIDDKNISYILEQSRYFLNSEVYQKIRMLVVCFSSITTNIDCLDLLKDNEDVKNTVIKEICSSCKEIGSLQASIETAMVEELKLV